MAMKAGQSAHGAEEAGSAGVLTIAMAMKPATRRSGAEEAGSATESLTIAMVMKSASHRHEGRPLGAKRRRRGRHPLPARRPRAIMLIHGPAIRQMAPNKPACAARAGCRRSDARCWSGAVQPGSLSETIQCRRMTGRPRHHRIIDYSDDPISTFYLWSMVVVVVGF